MPILYDDRIRELRAIGSGDNLKALTFIFILGAVSNKDLAQVCDLSDKTLSGCLDVLAGLGYITKSAHGWRIAAARQLTRGELLPIGGVGISDSPQSAPESPLQLSTELSTELSTIIVDQPPAASPAKRPEPVEERDDDVMSEKHGNSVSPIAIDSSSSDLDESKESTTTNYRPPPHGNSDSVIRENKIILRALDVQGKHLDELAASCPGPQYIAGKYAEWQDLNLRMTKAGKPQKAEFGLFIFWLKNRRDVIDQYHPPRCDLATLVTWAKEKRTRDYLTWDNTADDEEPDEAQETGS